jgi:hypothetical protein
MKLKSLVVVSIILASLGQAGSAKLLVGEVEHAEKLHPVEQTLTPGSLFDPANLPSPPAGAIRFFRIPKWLGGNWHKESQTNFYRYNYVTKQTDISVRTEPARADGAWGTQIDEQGNIWQFDATPFQTTVDSGSDYVVELVRSSEPVETGDTHIFLRRSIDTQIRVDKMTSRITSVESGEQLTTYLPEQDGLIKRESSAKVFDKDGQPMLLGKSFCYETRISPFAPQDTFQGKDMKALFSEFMKKQAESASAGSASGATQ